MQKKRLKTYRVGFPYSLGIPLQNNTSSHEDGAKLVGICCIALALTHLI